MPTFGRDEVIRKVQRGEDPIHIATVPKLPEWVDRATEEGTAILRVRRGLRPDQPNDFAIFTPDKLSHAARVHGLKAALHCTRSQCRPGTHRPIHAFQALWAKVLKLE